MNITLNKASEIIKEISKTYNEPECISKHRLSMWEAYLNETHPLRTLHLWKYSDPFWFDVNEKELLNKKSKLEIIANEDLEKKGIVLKEINEIFKIEPLKEKIKNTFESLVKEERSKLNFLNSATWTNGYFLYVPKNVNIENPITIKNHTENIKFQSTRILIILEENSSVNLIDEYFSLDDAGSLSNVVVEIFLEDNSKLNYLNLQALNKNSTYHLFQRAKIEKNATLTNLVISLGGKITKADLGVNLNSVKASSFTYGFVLGEGAQKFDHHTKINHLAPQTTSGLDFRVALKDKSRSAYTGNLKIIKEAINCNAYQENRNLLLSNEAKADSIPELEILTNDVEKCSHGVTVGQVDKDQIFYLMSRGLSEKEAEKIIIEGFLEPTVSRIPDESLQSEVRQRIIAKLEKV